MNTTKSSAQLEDSSSTWGERLLLNLLSYSLVLGPVAFTVLATRYRLWPASIQSSALIQRFVYGSIQTGSYTKEAKDDDKKLLLDDSQERSKRKQTSIESKSTNTTLNFIWCFVGLQLSYLVWGVLQEKIMTTEYRVTSPIGSTARPMHLKSSSPSDTSLETHNPTIITFHDSQFLVFINRIIAFVLSIVALVYNRPKKSPLHNYSSKYIQSRQEESKPPAPLYEYVYCSLSNILSSWCQYEALKYVNFPTQVLSKSCKIIPVMLMSKVMLHKRYKKADYFFALLLSLGMFIFLVYQPAGTGVKHERVASSVHSPPSNGSGGGSGNDSSYGKRLDDLSRHVKNSSLVSGLTILGLYLAFDSFTSNWQQSLFSRYGISNWQMMAAANFYSIVLTLTSLHQLGALKPAFKSLSASPQLLFDCLLMSIMSSIGQLFVYYTIKRFGSVIFAVIMTLRQFLAILLSCTIYGHRLTLGSSLGLLLVFCVVGLQMWLRSRGGKSHQSLGSGGGKEAASGAPRIQFKPQAK